jgi:hypothetical protein
MVFVPSKMADPYFDARRFPKRDIRHFLTKEYDLDFLEGILFSPDGLSSVVNAEGQSETPGKVQENVIFGIPKGYKFTMSRCVGFRCARTSSSLIPCSVAPCAYRRLRSRPILVPEHLVKRHYRPDALA